MTFFSTLDLFLRKGPTEGSPALRVQLADADCGAAVRQSIEALGVYVMSFRDQVQQFERLFLTMDLALAQLCKKSSTASAKASGRSAWIQWPAPSMVSSRACGKFFWMASRSSSAT